MSGGAPPLALGLVGTGRWGRNYIRTIEAMPGAVLAATATRDWREMIARTRLDGLIVATPPATHAGIAMAAVEAGIPVLVEKPLTLSLAAARALLACAESHAGRVLVDHVHLFQPAWAELKRQAAALGGPKRLRGVAGDRGPFRNDAPVLWDWGPHDVALCLDLMETMPRSAEARRLRQEGTGEAIGLTLTFPEGATAEIEIGNILDRKRRRFEVECERGALVMDTLADPILTMREGDEAARPVPVDRIPPLTVAVRCFLAMIGARGPDLDSLRLGVDVVAVLEACQRTLDA